MASNDNSSIYASDNSDHIETITGQTESNGTYVCEECFKIFPSKPVLRNHQRIIHANELYFKCDLCDRDFKRQSWLNLHKKQHSHETVKEIAPIWNKPDRRYLNYADQKTEILSDDIEVYENELHLIDDNE